MDKTLRGLYEFGPFRLIVGERLLLRDNEVVPLQPKAFDLLQVLVEQPGHLLGKEVLLKAVWPDSFVEESNLADNISRLRKALRDGENGQKFIETVPRHGYRFIASVKEVKEVKEVKAVDSDIAVAPAESSHTLPEEAPPVRLYSRPLVLLGLFGFLLLVLVGGFYFRFKPPPAIESLAVLPFSGNAEAEYLSDGLTESLINQLSGLSSLRVTARAMAFRYKGKEVNPGLVGRELDVNFVLTGKVELREGSLTVQADLVNTATGGQIWGERYQGKRPDIFSVQEEIAGRITEALRLKLNGEQQRQLTRRYTNSPEVYDLYLLGLYLFSKRTQAGLHKAIEYFQQAVAKDPNFALGYTGLANCYVTSSAEGDPGKLLPLAKAAVVRALEIDNNLAEAHASLGWIKWIHELDWRGAESEFRKALELNSNSADSRYRYARLLADTGRFDEARSQVNLAIQLDPLSIQYRKGVPYILYLSGDVDEAIIEYRKLTEITPDFSQAQRELGLAYEQKGMYQEALDQLQKTLNMPENYGKTMNQADIGHVYAAWGKRTEAQKVLTELVRRSDEGYVSAYDVAVIHAGLGNADEAFAWFDKAIEQRPYWLVWLKLDPRLDHLRADQRFRNLLRDVGLLP